MTHSVLYSQQLKKQWASHLNASDTELGCYKLKNAQEVSPHTDRRMRLFLSGSRNSSTSASVTLPRSFSMLGMSLRIPEKVFYKRLNINRPQIPWIALIYSSSYFNHQAAQTWVKYVSFQIQINFSTLHWACLVYCNQWNTISRICCSSSNNSSCNSSSSGNSVTASQGVRRTQCKIWSWALCHSSSVWPPSRSGRWMWPFGCSSSQEAPI